MKGLKEIVKKANNTVAGVAAAPGIVIGKAHLFHKEVLAINDQNIIDVEEAVENFREALGKAKKELTKIFDLAHEKMGTERSGIFSAQLMILDDPVLQESIEKRIRAEKKHPDFIVQNEITKYQDLMIVANEDYLKERALDIEDIKNRIIRNLQKKRLQSKITPGVIVVSEGLTPADTLLFSKWDAKAYVTDRGGLTSHAAILARSLDIPAIVGTHDGSHHINQDDLLIVDGFHGYVFVNPTEEQLAFYNDKIKKMQAINEELKELKDKPAQTVDNKIISINANVDVSGEIEMVVTNGAEGIGLYRTEQMIEENGEIPNEDEQSLTYSRLAQRIYPRMVTIRAFDTGGDKVKIWDFKEANPFLGLRGIRFLLENRAMFKAQIRALLRANLHDNIQFMLPMVSSIEEIRQTKFLLRECAEELKNEQKPYSKKMRLGIMIEVPSAAVMAYEYAKEVDFLSIGTNDLIQYLMAVDRGNDHVSYLYQEFHPAVLRTIANIIKDGKRGNAVVSMCGEMAADNLALPLLLGLGLESISVAASAIPSIKRTIRALSFEKATVLADECLAASHEVEVIAMINKFFKENDVPRTRNII
jgi:phosphoenolpyruvate-protein phosphotransferase (PTS system enzyme I)